MKNIKSILEIPDIQNFNNLSKDSSEIKEIISIKFKKLFKRKDKILRNLKITRNCFSIIINKNKNNKEKEKKENCLLQFFTTEKSSKHYKVISNDIKEKILEDLKYLSNREVSEKYGTSIRNIVRWKSKGYKRKSGSGRRFLDPDLNSRLMKWYYSEDPQLITSKIFRNKAKELSNNKNFKASMGWLTLMKKKYNLKFKNY